MRTLRLLAVVLILAVAAWFTFGNWRIAPHQLREDITSNTASLGALWARVDSLEFYVEGCVPDWPESTSYHQTHDIKGRNIWGDRAWGGDTLATMIHPRLVCVRDTLWFDVRTQAERRMQGPPRWMMVTP